MNILANYKVCLFYLIALNNKKIITIHKMKSSKFQKIQELLNQGHFQEALHLIEEIEVPQDSLDNFLIYSMKITALMGLGRYYDAIETSKEQLRLINKYRALAMKSLYYIYSSIGNNEEALRVLNEILKMPKINEAQAFYDKIDLAMLWARKGEFFKSIDILQEEIEKTKDAIAQIELCIALGDIYFYFVQDMDKAREEYYKAFNLALRSEGNIRNKAFMRYAEMLTKMGDFDEAISILNEIQEKTSSDLEKAEVLRILALLDKSNTKEYLRKALAIYEKFGIKNSEADVLQELADVEENIEDSIKIFNQAISIYDSIGMKEMKVLVQNKIAQKLLKSKKYEEAEYIMINLINEKEISKFTLAFCYVGLAAIKKEQGKFSEALHWLIRAEKLLDEIRHELFFEERVMFSNVYTKVKRVMASILTKFDNVSAIRKAEESKSRSLIDAISLSRLPKPSNDEIFNLENNLIDEYNAAYISRNPVAKDIYKKLEGLWLQIEKNPAYSEYINLRLGKPVEIAKITELIEHDTTIIDYLILDQELLIFIIDKNEISVSIIEKKKKDIEALCNKFRELKIDDKLIEEASDVLLKPVEDRISKAKHICISPDLYLYYIPFHALYLDGSELILSKTVSYMPNLTSFTYCKQRKSKGNVLIIGGSPNNDLKFAVQEAKEIAELLKGEVKNYSREGLLAKLNDSRIISFSCHAFYSFHDYGLASYILLPNGQSITARDVLKTRLSAEIVSLSACETAKLSYSEGGDVLGLLSSFLYAGAKSVVASLWKLNDYAAYLSMKEFYSNLLAGLNKAEALRLALLNTKNKFPEIHNWAPLILVGDYSTTLNIN